MVCTFLIDACLHGSFWIDVILTAAYVVNRLPTPLLNGHFPFQKLFSHIPDYSFVWVFGCQCFPNLTPTTKHKLQPRFIRCVFLGYASHYKAYKCLEPLSGRIYISRNVVFHEHVFSYVDILNSSPSELSSSPLLLLRHGRSLHPRFYTSPSQPIPRSVWTNPCPASPLGLLRPALHRT